MFKKTKEDDLVKETPSVANEYETERSNISRVSSSETDMEKAEPVKSPIKTHETDDDDDDDDPRSVVRAKTDADNMVQTPKLNTSTIVEDKNTSTKEGSVSDGSNKSKSATSIATGTSSGTITKAPSSNETTSSDSSISTNSSDSSSPITNSGVAIKTPSSSATTSSGSKTDSSSSSSSINNSSADNPSYTASSTGSSVSSSAPNNTLAVSTITPKNPPIAKDLNPNKTTATNSDEFIQVKLLQHQLCGENKRMNCGVYEIKVGNSAGDKYRVFFANLSEVKKIEKIIENLVRIECMDFKLADYFHPLISHLDLLDHETYYIKEIKDGNDKTIGPSAEKVLKRIKRSGFIGFYDDIDENDANSMNYEDFFFIAHGAGISKIEFFNSEQYNFELAVGNGNQPKENLICSKPILKRYYWNVKYIIRIREITNIFRHTGLKAIHIEFRTEADGNLPRDGEFTDFKKYYSANIFSDDRKIKHTAYDGLDVYYNYAFVDPDIIEVLENILNRGALDEFEKQYNKQSWLSSYSPFNVLLVGPADKTEPYLTKLKMKLN